MNIQDLKDKPYMEIVNRVAELHPQVEAARNTYNDLSDEVRAYEGARELVNYGIWVGDKVWVSIDGKRKYGEVVFDRHPKIQLWKNGKPAGEPYALWMLESIEKAA